MIKSKEEGNKVDFRFIKIPNLNLWVISAPKRATRPTISGKKQCVFCPGNEEHDPEVYRIGGEPNDQNWQVRVIQNKYPFAPIHEVVVLSPTHKESLAQETVDQFRLGIETYVNRYNTHKKHGAVVIFGNSGHDAGESIGHAHAQIAVVPPHVDLEVPKLENFIAYSNEHFKIGEFEIICPPYSQWPDEVWIVPLERGKTFGEIAYAEIESLSYIWHRLIKIFELRHGLKFPHNFYIYPYKDWYVRILPRAKIAGGFEIATGIFVDTQDPADTMQFIRDHFAETDTEKIRKSKAKYRKGV